MMKKLHLLLFSCFLSGCSLLSQEEPLPLYTLKSGHILPNATLSSSLGIDVPLGEASLDTQRIAVTPSLYERDYLADGQWPDRLPKIVQEVLLESLSERWGGAAISRVSMGLQVKYVLQTEIQDFSVHQLSSGHPEARLKIAFKLINLRTRDVLAAHVFSVKEPVCIVSMNGIVGALNKGLQALIGQVIPWIEGSLKESVLNTRSDKLSR